MNKITNCCNVSTVQGDFIINNNQEPAKKICKVHYLPTLLMWYRRLAMMNKKKATIHSTKHGDLIWMMQNQIRIYTSTGKSKQETKITFCTNIQFYSPEINGVLCSAHKLVPRPSMSNSSNELKSFIDALINNLKSYYQTELRRFKTKNLIL